MTMATWNEHFMVDTLGHESYQITCSWHFLCAYVRIYQNIWMDEMNDVNPHTSTRMDDNDCYAIKSHKMLIRGAEQRRLRQHQTNKHTNKHRKNERGRYARLYSNGYRIFKYTHIIISPLSLSFPHFVAKLFFFFLTYQIKIIYINSIHQNRQNSQKKNHKTNTQNSELSIKHNKMILFWKTDTLAERNENQIK